MTVNAKVEPTNQTFSIRSVVDFFRHKSTLIAFLLVCLFFGVINPAFSTGTNLLNIVDQSAVLAVVAMAMTIVIIAGGIDLSVAVSLDLGAMSAVSLLKAGIFWPFSIVAGLLTGALVGLFNAFNVVRFGISPFLATLGMLFIGESIQRIYTQGGEPIYMARMTPAYRFIGKGDVGGIPFEVILAVLVVLTFFLLIERTIHGMRWRAIGAQYEAAQINGIRVERYTALAYVISAITCAFAGIMLSSSLSSYVPVSGIAYLLDAIGAVFIGASIDKESRPNILGTLLGVLFFGVINNGLNLLGVHFYWHTVARGLLIFIALILTTLNQRKSE
ncbi:MAG: ABC transporter permease [Chloroflexota bacterium]